MRSGRDALATQAQGGTPWLRKHRARRPGYAKARAGRPGYAKGFKFILFFQEFFQRKVDFF